MAFQAKCQRQQQYKTNKQTKQKTKTKEQKQKQTNKKQTFYLSQQLPVSTLPELNTRNVALNIQLKINRSRFYIVFRAEYLTKPT